jgi:uncharacterized membrane protein
MLQLFIAVVVLLFLGLFIVLSVPLTDDEDDRAVTTTETSSIQQ